MRSHLPRRLALAAFGLWLASLPALAGEPTVYESAASHLERAKAEKDPARKLEHLDEAAKELRRFLKENPQHDLAGQAQLRLGGTQLEKGRILTAQAGTEQDDDAKEMLLAEARGAIRAAETTLQGAVKHYEEQIRGFPKFLPRSKVKLRAQRTRARQGLIDAKLHQASTAFELGKTYSPGSEEHKQHLTEAAKRFHKIYVDYRRLLAGLYAAQWEGRCYHELGDLRRALGLYMELLAFPDLEEPAFRDVKTKALRHAMAAWNDPRQKQYQESIKRGEAWILKARESEGTAPDGLAIVYQTALAKHAVIQHELQAAKNDPTVPVDEERHRRLKLDVILHASLVAELEGEYQDAAKRLLRQYRGEPKKP